MNANAPTKNVCATCCSVVTLMTAVLFLIFDFVEFGNLNTINSRIDAMNYSYVSCYDACGNYYVSYGSLCCLYYNYNYCYSLSTCIQNQLSSLRTQHDDIVAHIWIYSIISVVMVVAYCCIRKCAYNSQLNRANIAINPLLDHLNGHINRSQDANAQRQKRIDVNYESFAYQDDQNNCCICLEDFKSQKAILLKCGHIFHSLCIRDWAVKQENCPVCRSSQ